MFNRNGGNPFIINPATLLQRIFKDNSAAVHVNDCFVGAKAITPDDAKEIEPTSGLIIGTAGTLHVTMANGDDITFPAAVLAANTFHKLAVKKVWATGTTATGIIGLV